MTTDRELLELAAKADGWSSWDWLAAPGINVYDASGRHAHWNPLEDDGDAFRLLVDLKMNVTVETDPWTGDVRITVEASDKDASWFEVILKDDPKDPREVMRRAITNVAAQIGGGK